MEYLDVLDEDGNLTGKKKSKPDVHKDGDWHKTVHIWIVTPNGELLIQKRSPEMDSYPDLWDISTAGHISAGEDSMTSALREADEELGLKLKAENFHYLFTAIQQAVLQNGTYINNEYNDVYLVELDPTSLKLNLQKEEVSETRWMPYQELEKQLISNSLSFVPHPDEYDKLFPELHKRYF
ncbi:MAG: NUDIX domain-containing protein [Minisyncoccia bacterium]|jgi:isopentenyldiphosphate isomerase